ncbi:MAG: hypothetical protein HOC74_23515 [Gemmatimonadetes bacterium]|nr:hypothetical protein [Gemmatimonadota bacterium]
MTYYFLGILCALLITIALVLDLERKRRKIRHIALRLEEITRGKTRLRVRHVRQLTLSTFLYEQLIGQVNDEIAAVEEEHGIEPTELPHRDFFFLERRLRQMQDRVERLAQVIDDS